MFAHYIDHIIFVSESGNETAAITTVIREIVWMSIMCNIIGNIVYYALSRTTRQERNALKTVYG